MVGKKKSLNILPLLHILLIGAFHCKKLCILTLYWCLYHNIFCRRKKSKNLKVFKTTRYRSITFTLKISKHRRLFALLQKNTIFVKFKILIHGGWGVGYDRDEVEDIICTRRMAGPPPLQCKVLWTCLIPARRPRTGRWRGSPPPSRRIACRSRPCRPSSPLAGRSRRSDRRLEDTIMLLEQELC